MNIKPKVEELYYLVEKKFPKAFYREDEDTCYIAFYAKDFHYSWPQGEIYLAFPETGECFFTAYNLKSVGVSGNAAKYFDILRKVNEWNDSYDLLKWTIDDEGVLIATHTAYNNFDGDLEGYLTLIEKALEELRKVLDDPIFNHPNEHNVHSN